MKRPSFQFYPADWKGNAKLRRCSEAARGAWMDILCILHDGDEYGVCRWPLADLAHAAGVALKLARELAEKLVLKGGDMGAQAYVFTPRHAGKDGEPVTLVVGGEGPCWYSSRLVRDEWIRQRRGAATQFTADNQPPKAQPKPTPKHTIGERHGDGPSSPSTSPSAEEDTSLRSVSAAPSQALALADDPILITFPTNRPNQLYSVLQSHFDQLAPLYPAVDVPQEFRGMAAWLISNPKNAKTKSGMPRFINSWLSKAQNRSKPNGHGSPSKNDNWLAGAAELAAEIRSERR